MSPRIVAELTRLLRARLDALESGLVEAPTREEPTRACQLARAARGLDARQRRMRWPGEGLALRQGGACGLCRAAD
jgi:hypothetical protein